MYAYTQSTFSYGAPYGTALPPYPNGLGIVSEEQRRTELHAKNYRAHQEARVSHNGIAEARDAMLKTAGGAGLPQVDGTINYPGY